MSQTNNVKSYDLPHYHVTAAVIQNENKILISQRMADDSLGGLWEFPGGKQEPGESLESCLIREISEELNIEIVIKKYLFSIGHIYKNKKITLHIFLCLLKNGTPQKQEVQDWLWIDFANITDYELTPADVEVIKRLSDYI